MFEMESEFCRIAKNIREKFERDTFKGVGMRGGGHGLYQIIKQTAKKIIL